MDQHLAKKLNICIQADSWIFFEQYLKQELERANIRFYNAKELHEFCAIQAEMKTLKKLLDFKETIRLSLEI